MRKTAIVTGASSGIGRGIAFALAECGYNLVLAHYQDWENAKQAKRAITARFSGTCFLFEGDLACEKSPEELATYAIDVLKHVDVLVNNAGVTRFASVTDIDVNLMNDLYGLNFRAPMLLSKQIAKHMIAMGIRGSIVNTVSTRGFRAYPKDALYGGLKAALIRASESMALDLAPHGIRVNCVAPGAIQIRDNEKANKTYEQLGKRIPLGRVGQPEDIGRAVSWLVSQEASYITGHTLKVDGGLILPGMPEHVADGYADDGWGSM